jgi:hypothetical protein
MVLPGNPAAISGPSQVDLFFITSSQYNTAGATDATSYFWSLTPSGAGTISGTGVTSTITWNSSFLGLAYVKVKAVNGCGDGGWSDTKEIQVVKTTGLIEAAKTGVKVYPIPNDGNFKIDLHGTEGKAMVRILNPSGLELFSKWIEGNSITSVKAQLAPGLYFLMIESAGNTIKTKLVIK